MDTQGWRWRNACRDKVRVERAGNKHQRRARREAWNWQSTEGRAISVSMHQDRRRSFKILYWKTT